MKVLARPMQLRCWRRGALALHMMSFLALGAGCNGGGGLYAGGDEQLAAPLGAISIYQLAGRLGMTVVADGATAATLRDGSNVVIIFAGPGGRAYVNGAPADLPGGITSVADTLFVPRDLAETIRPMLSGPAKARRPAGPVDGLGGKRRLGRVVLDPGHGGKDPGAVAAGGIHEKAVVLDASLTMAGLLKRAGARVILTRGDDSFVELNERADIANRIRADLLVSIHADSCRNRSASGFTVYVARAAGAGSLRLARKIERRLAALGIAGRGVRKADYRVLVRTECPAVLVELGYLSNAAELRKLSLGGYRRRLAEAICRGIVEYLEQR